MLTVHCRKTQISMCHRIARAKQLVWFAFYGLFKRARNISILHRGILRSGLLMLVITVTGCSLSSPPPPPTQYYLLAPPSVTGDQTSQSTVGPMTIVFEGIMMAAPYDGENIVVKSAAGEVQFYTYEKWAAAPAKMIESYLHKTLIFDQRFQLGNRRTRHKDAYKLVLEIEEFAHDRVGDPHQASLRAFAGLTKDMASGYQWVKAYQIKIPTSSDQPKDIVKSLNNALRQFCQELTDDLEKQFTAR